MAGLAVLNVRSETFHLISGTIHCGESQVSQNMELYSHQDQAMPFLPLFLVSLIQKKDVVEMVAPSDEEKVVNVVVTEIVQLVVVLVRGSGF